MKGHTRRLSMEQRRMLEGYIFILPWIIGFIAFFMYPLIQSIQLSFSKLVKYSTFETQWVGFDNYARAFTWDIEFLPLFWQMVSDTLINLPLINIFALFLAILLNRDLKLKGLFRGVFFLPVLLGTGFVMEQLLGLGVGERATEVARGVAIPKEVLLYLGPTVTAVVQGFLNRLTLILWKSGVQIILFLAGLQGISSSLYESAKCDGATEWEMFWKITLPMISPVILLSLIYTLIDSFADAGNPLLKYIQSLTVEGIQYEYAAALSWIYFAFVFALIALTFVIVRRFIYNAGER